MITHDVRTTYFMRRLGAIRRAEQLAASIQFDLARSPISDEQLEELAVAFGAEPSDTGWGLAEGLDRLITNEPKKVPVESMAELQRNLQAQGYLPPGYPATGQWDDSTYIALQRQQRDTMNEIRTGNTMLSMPMEAGARAIGYTFPSEVFQALIGSAKEVVLSTPEHLESLGALGGAGAGALIGGGLVGPPGAIGGAIVGGVAGLFADIFGEDEGEGDQSFWAKFVDALTPLEEYTGEGGARQFWDDLGWAATAASIAWLPRAIAMPRGLARRLGVPEGVIPSSWRTIQEARGVGGALSGAGVPLRGAPWEMATYGSRSTLSAMGKQGAIYAGRPTQLGIPGSMARWVTGKVAPGSVAGISKALQSISPVAHMQRLGPIMVWKTYSQLNAAAIGARLSAGFAAGTTGKFKDAYQYFEETYGRPPSENEQREISRAVADRYGTDLEKAIANAPTLGEGTFLDAGAPLVGRMTDLSAFFLWPTKFLPLGGQKALKMAESVMGSTTMAPIAEVISAEEKIGIGAATAKAVQMDPWKVIYLRSEYGLYRESMELMRKARYSPARIFAERKYEQARALIIRGIRKVGIGSPEHEKIMGWSLKDPGDFRAWMMGQRADPLSPQAGGGLAKLDDYCEASRLARRGEEDLRAGAGTLPMGERGVPEGFPWETTGARTGAERVRQPYAVLEEPGALPMGERGVSGGRVPLPERPTVQRRVSLIGGRKTPGGQLDIARMEDEVARLEKAAVRYERIARNPRVGPATQAGARQRAIINRGLVADLQREIKASRATQAGRKVLVPGEDFRILPARLDFMARQDWEEAANGVRFRVRQMEAAANNPAGRGVAEQEYVNYVDELLAKDPALAEAADLLGRDKVASGKKLANLLDERAKHTPQILDMPQEFMFEMERLGYKPVRGGPDVLFPEDMKAVSEALGMGDYARHARFWDNLGLSPRMTTERSRFRIRQAQELSPIEDVLRRHGIKLNARQAQGRIYQRIHDIQHGRKGAPTAAHLSWVREQGRHAKWRLFPQDVRDLTVDDILMAFDDVPGFTPEAATDMYGAIRHGASFGDELGLKGPLETLHRLGRGMRLAGLPGWTEFMRSMRLLKDPYGVRRAIQYWEKTGKYPVSSEFARSVPRAGVKASLADIAAARGWSDQELGFQMAVFDAVADASVRSGQFNHVDDFYEALKVQGLERYVPGIAHEQLLQKVLEFPRIKGGVWTPEAGIWERDFQLLFRHMEDYKNSPEWYGEGGAAIRRVFGGRRVRLVDETGKAVGEADFDELVMRVVAATSFGQDPAPNMTIAMNVLAKWIENPRHVFSRADGILGPRHHPSHFNKILHGNWIPDTPKGGPFYQALRGNPDVPVIDRRMIVMFGFAHKSEKTGEWIVDATGPEKDWIAEQVIKLADAAGIKAATAQERLWLAFNDIVLDISKAARRRGDTEVADLYLSFATARAGENYAEVLAIPEYAARADEILGMLASSSIQLRQQAATIVRGSIEFGPDYERIVRLFKTADWTTIVHENAHMLRRFLPEADVLQIERALGVVPPPQLGFHAVTPEEFVAARAKLPHGKPGEKYEHVLTWYTPDQIREQGMRAFLSEDGKVGFMLVPDGGIANVFNAGGPPGAGRLATLEAIRMGGNKVEHFEGKLSEIYGELGFREAERYPFDPEIMLSEHPLYDIEKYGRPDYIVETIPDAARQELLQGTLEAEARIGFGWTREKEELFAARVEEYFKQRMSVQAGAIAGPEVPWARLRNTLAALWARMRGHVRDSNVVTRGERKVFDSYFEDIFQVIPETAGKRFARRAVSRPTMVGAVAGAGVGALADEGNPQSMLKGALYGAAIGAGPLFHMAAKSYGYLPDHLTKLNQALRFTTSALFDLGRYSEQNMIAYEKYGLPFIWAPEKSIKAGMWETPYHAGKVTGKEAWHAALRLLDDANGGSGYTGAEDIFERMWQAGILGFRPREFEAAQALMLWQRAEFQDLDKIRDAVSWIGRYGPGRTPAEMSANFIFFPFSFSKKLITSLGEFVLAAPGRNLLIHEGLARYHESELDDGLNRILERNLPILKDLWRVNNLSFGMGPGRFILKGLGDRRTRFGEAVEILTSLLVPSGMATPLAQAAGGAGDYAIHAFVPLVTSGESIDRAGGIENFYDILNRYIPLVREVDQYFLNLRGGGPMYSAVGEQATALTQGAAPQFQAQMLADSKREAKEKYLPYAMAMGYSSVDGLFNSMAGAMFKNAYDEEIYGLEEQYPQGAERLDRWTNTANARRRSLGQLVHKDERNPAEEAIVRIAEQVDAIKSYARMANWPAQLTEQWILGYVRTQAAKFIKDERFRELWTHIFMYDYGPIEVIAA